MDLPGGDNVPCSARNHEQRTSLTGGKEICYSDLPMKWDLYSLQYIAGPGERGLEVGVDVHEVRSRV